MLNKPKLTSIGTVSADFYDRDYYENGAASGKFSYNGYWYGDNIPACVAWATDTYQRWGPFSDYLELGCGRGWAIFGFIHSDLPVRPIGVDISHYAVTTAATETVSYLFEHDATDLGFLKNKSSDIIFSNDFLEHLTKIQIIDCLNECRRVARNKIVHLISIGENIDYPDGEAPANQDQSHVTVKSEAWWTRLFNIMFVLPEWRVEVVARGTTIEVVVTKVGEKA